MGGAAPDMACRKRLRSRDSATIEIPSDDDEEVNKVRGGVSGVKNGKASTAAILEKRKQKEGRASSSNKNMMSGDREKEKKTATWNGHNKVKSRKKVSTASLEKMRKKEKLCHASNKKKMQICDDEEGKNRHNRDYNLKNRKESTMISEKKNKEKMNKTDKEKMRASDSKERKKMSGHNGVKKIGEVSTAFFGNEKKGERLKLNKNTEKETAPLTPVVKEKRMRPSESEEMTMPHDKSNGRNVPSNVSKEKKMDTSSGSNYKKRKREERHSLSKKEKMRCNASDKKIYSGTVQEKKISGSGKEKNRQAPFTFFKFMYTNFEEFLLIPPAVLPKFKDLTDHYIYLEDSEKRHSKVRLSVVDGSLAFHQGWDIFVSDHLIKLGEFLLFEYTARKRFSVRIFGTDCCERLHFKKDPKIVEQGIGYGPPQDNNNGSLIDRQCKTKDTSPLHCKRQTAILILDSGNSSEHNEDILNVTSDADSTRHVTINTNKDPKSVQSDIGTDGVCGTKCISPSCSEGKTSSEIIVTDAAPLKHENDGRVGLELEKHDLGEDLMRKQGINSIPLDSITAVEKHQNHCETIASQNIYRKYGAPGGFRCLEKWTKAIVNSPAALDGTVPIKPENTRKTGSKLVDGYGSIGPNTGNEYFCSEDHHTLVLPVFTMHVKEPLSADRVSKFSHVGTDIYHSINEKGGGAAVQIQTQGEQLEAVGSIVNSQSDNIPMSANTEVLGKYGALEQNAAGPEGTCAFIEPMLTVPVEKPLSPDGISKCESSRTEIDHNVNGKGTIVQLETNMDQVEPAGSSVCSQSSDVAIHANHVVVPESEHFFSRQEGRKSVNCAITESLLPMKDKILELDGHSLLKFSLQLCIPDTTRKWLELPKSLPNTVNKQKRHDRNIIMLKDPMKRLWPVLYHENPVFLGFTTGWKHFVAGNNLETGDLCELTKEADGDEPVFSVQITKRRQ